MLYLAVHIRLVAPCVYTQWLPSDSFLYSGISNYTVQTPAVTYIRAHTIVHPANTMTDYPDLVLCVAGMCLSDGPHLLPREAQEAGQLHPPLPQTQEEVAHLQGGSRC